MKSGWEMEWANFEYREFSCSHCGANHMSTSVIDDLQELRSYCPFSFIITSGYRCPEHPIEAAKPAPGPHNTGLAVDILLSHQYALKALRHAVSSVDKDGNAVWSGVGLNQRGNISKRILHLDQCEETPSRPRPHIWTY